jgi:hypothetical protein
MHLGSRILDCKATMMALIAWRCVYKSAVIWKWIPNNTSWTDSSVIFQKRLISTMPES